MSWIKPTNYPDPYPMGFDLRDGGSSYSNTTKQDKVSKEQVRELSRRASAPSFFCTEKEREEDDVVGDHPLM